ncbi:hypothetical protein IM25_21425 [Rhodococcus sp. p52]|nr:hypothetical protein IM25_21425 [Rhodococcus sp. p52]
MSDELAALLEEHRFDPETRICACGVECGVMCDNLTYLEHLNHALRNRFSVVELPEPDGYAEEQPYWDSTDYVEAEDGHVYLIGSTGYRKPNEARDLAAALVAAANRAEAQS